MITSNAEAAEKPTPHSIASGMQNDACEWPGSSSRIKRGDTHWTLQLRLDIPRELNPWPPKNMHMNAPTIIIHKS